MILDLYRGLVRQARTSIWSSTNLPNPHRSLPAAKYCPSASCRLACCIRRDTPPARYACSSKRRRGAALARGDTLFEGGIRPHDFSGGSLEQILHSIRHVVQAARRNCGRSRPWPGDHIGEEREEIRTSGAALVPDETEHDLETMGKTMAASSRTNGGHAPHR